MEKDKQVNSRKINNTWNEFFAILESTDFNDDDNVGKNFQIPKSLMKLLKEDNNIIQEKEDQYIPLRTFILTLICKGGNYSYNDKRDKNDKFYRAKNGNNLYNYYKEK